MPKTVLPSKFQEWKGLDRISPVVHEMHCIFREIGKDDYGLDGEIELVVEKADGKGYETAGGIIKVQAKSGSSWVTQDRSDGFITPVKKADLEYWHKTNFPVILVVYHPSDDRLYWKDIKAYVKQTPQVFAPPHHVAFHKRVDEFSPDAYDRLCHLAEASPPRVTRNVQERLYSNLLPVTRLPRMMTHAPTSFTTRADIRSRCEGYLPPYCTFENRLYTFGDLRDSGCALRGFCDTTHISDMPPARWAQDEERRGDFIYLLNQLLGSHTRGCGLRYDREFKRTFFPREDDKTEEFKRPWWNVRTARQAPSRIVAKYYQYGPFVFWRHLAANLSFKVVGQDWYLQIVPRYFFTVDGRIPCDREMVGPYTTRIKAVERNIHVLNHVLFWADVLSEGRSTIDMRVGRMRVLSVSKEPLIGIAEFAIPDDPAIYEEPQPSPQLSFGTTLFGEPEGDDEEQDGDGSFQC